jgi:hypothetical protein
MPAAATEIFPLWRIVLDGVAVAGIGFFALGVLRRQRSAAAGGGQFMENLALAAIAGLSVLAWRASSNVPSFNQDALPAISPGDALTPLWTYVCLTCSVAFWQHEIARWAKVRTLLVVLAFLVNVVVI